MEELTYAINRDSEVILKSKEKRIAFVVNPEMSSAQINNSMQVYHTYNDGEKEIEDDYVYRLIADGDTTVYSIPWSEEYEKMLATDILKQEKTSVGWKKANFISIELLRNCLHGMIKEDLSNCNVGICNKYNADTKTRDFLFVSVYLLEHLLIYDRKYEALSILKQIGSCVPICGNVMKSNDCNCS